MVLPESIGFDIRTETGACLDNPGGHMSGPPPSGGGNDFKTAIFHF